MPFARATSENCAYILDSLLDAASYVTMMPWTDRMVVTAHIPGDSGAFLDVVDALIDCDFRPAGAVLFRRDSAGLARVTVAFRVSRPRVMPFGVARGGPDLFDVDVTWSPRDDVDSCLTVTAPDGGEHHMFARLNLVGFDVVGASE